MGIFDFFRKKVKTDEISEKKKETVKLSEAIDFLKRYSEEDKGREKVQLKEEEIKKRTTDIKELLDKLEKAEVPRNIKESSAVQNKVFGNRIAYIGYVALLLKKLEQREDFEKEFKEFGEKSIKSYYATQYLFGKELQETAKSLQELSRAFLEKKKLNDELKNSKWKKTEDKIRLLQETSTIQGRIKGEIEIIEKELKRVEPLSVERKYVELKNSAEFAEAVKKREEAEQHARKIKEEVVEFFSGIKRILKKANNKRKMWIIQYYIDEPVDALLEDNEFKIVSFVEEIKKDDIGEDISGLRAVTKEKLTSLKSRYENAVEAMKKAEKKSDVETKVFELEDSLYRLNSQKTVLQKKLDELKKKEEVNIDELKKDIEARLTEISGKIIEITV